jgi:hypothetical protein
VWDETAAIAPYRVLCWSPRKKNARANPSKLASFTKKKKKKTKDLAANAAARYLKQEDLRGRKCVVRKEGGLVGHTQPQL